jgi:hypothetical protein
MFLLQVEYFRLISNQLQILTGNDGFIKFGNKFLGVALDFISEVFMLPST